MALATATDVAARMPRELTAAEITLAETLLEDVEDMILERIPTLMDQITAVPPVISSATVVRIEAMAVVRVLKNPDGSRQRSRTIDDYQESWTIDRASSTGELYIDDADWTILLPTSGHRVGSRRLVAYGDI